MTPREHALKHMSGPDTTAVELVVFPGAGAGPGFYSTWIGHLPASWRMTAVCLPGRGGRYEEEAFTDLHDAATEVAQALDVSGLVRPVLFGHSMGALLALETAARTEASLLITAACAPPGPMTAAYFQHVDADEVRDDTRALVRALGVDDEQIVDELVELTTPTLLTDLAMLAKYSPPDRPVASNLVSYYGCADDVPALTWSAHTSGTADTVRFPGGHHFPRHCPQLLIRDMQKRLDTNETLWRRT